MIELHTRNFYFFTLVTYFLVIYGVRYVTLSFNPETFMFFRFNVLDFELINQRLPLIFILPIFFSLLGMLVPRKLQIKKISKSKYLILRIWFYISCIGYLITAYTTGQIMGQDHSGSFLNRFLFGIFLSILPLKFLVIVLSISAPSFRFALINILVPYAFTLFLFGHKGALYLVLFLAISLRVLLGYKAINLRIASMGIIFLLAYPFIQVLISMLRGQSMLDLDYIYINSQVEGFLDYIIFALSSFSRRLSALDVLALPSYAENFYFGPLILTGYLMKGIFFSGLIEFAFGMSPYGLGRVFAINSLGQGDWVANSYDPSLLGLIIYSPNPIGTAMLIASSIILILFILKRLTRGGDFLYVSLFIYFLFELSSFMLTGNFQSIGLSLRILVMIILFNNISNVFISKR